MPASVVQAVENFLSQCGSSVATNDELLRDYLISRLEAVIANLEELMQCVGVSDPTRRLRYRACDYLHRFQCGEHVCTQAVAEINVFNITRYTGHRGRPLMIINIEQVELLRSAGFTWQEVADAVGVSRTTLWRR